MDPVQSLGSGFSVHIEKVFLCSGKEGYIPKYQPSTSEYGCLADAPNLLYRFKIIDKEQPDTEDNDLRGVDFNAVLAVDDPDARPLVDQAGADGFKMDSNPLFQASVGSEWYLHTIYTVRSSARQMFRRHAVSRRSANSEIGPGFDRGTNMHMIPMVKESKNELFVQAKNSSISSMIAAICGAILLGAMVVIVFVRRKRSDNNTVVYKAGSKPERKHEYKPIVRPNGYHVANLSDSSASSRSGTEV